MIRRSRSDHFSVLASDRVLCYVTLCLFLCFAATKRNHYWAGRAIPRIVILRLLYVSEGIWSPGPWYILLDCTELLPKALIKWGNDKLNQHFWYLHGIRPPVVVWVAVTTYLRNLFLRLFVDCIFWSILFRSFSVDTQPLFRTEPTFCSESFAQTYTAFGRALTCSTVCAKKALS